MSLPRDLSAADLVKALERLGDQVTRQTGRYMRGTTTQGGGEHHLTIPRHGPLRVSTLGAILGEVAGDFELTRDRLLERRFGRP